MAMTELQMPDKNEFYVKIKDTASRMRKTLNEWEALMEFVGEMGTVELDSMGVPAGEVRTDLVNFRSALNDLISLWNGNAVSAPTVSPLDAINKVRAMY